MGGWGRQLLFYNFSPLHLFLSILPIPLLISLATGLLECHHNLASRFPGMSDPGEKAGEKSHALPVLIQDVTHHFLRTVP